MRADDACGLFRPDAALDPEVPYNPPMSWPKLRFYGVVVVPAGVLMALEIVSSRLLAPTFGNSISVWGSIISVFLAAMSVGYFWGGRLADDDPSLARLGSVLLTAACFQALLLLFGEPVVTGIGDVLGSGALGTLAAASVVFAPPTIPLAMVAPFVIRIAALDLKELGSTAGQLYALSTAGSLAGTLGATFVLIPSLALRPIFSLLLAATTLSALVLLATNLPKERLRAVLGVSLLLLSVVPEKLLHDADDNLVAKRLTPYQTLSVIKNDQILYLYSDRQLHGSLNLETGRPHIRYPKEVPAAYLFQPDIRKVALIGVGSGSVGHYLHQADPELVIDQVDVDGAVMELAVEYFEIQENEHSRLHVEDGRRFLKERADQRWDFIYLDTYIGHTIPFHLSTVEFFQLIRGRLEIGGVLGLNFAGSLHSPFGKSMLKTLSRVFPFLYVFRVPGGNHLFIATAQGPRLGREELAARAEALDARFQFEVSVAEIAGDFREEQLDLDEVQVFEDHFAPVNHLRRFD